MMANEFSQQQGILSTFVLNPIKNHFKQNISLSSTRIAESIICYRSCSIGGTKAQKAIHSSVSKLSSKNSVAGIFLVGVSISHASIRPTWVEKLVGKIMSTKSKSGSSCSSIYGGVTSEEFCLLWRSLFSDQCVGGGMPRTWSD